jgi:hypothetical protein
VIRVRLLLQFQKYKKKTKTIPEIPSCNFRSNLEWNSILSVPNMPPGNLWANTFPKPLQHFQQRGQVLLCLLPFVSARLRFFQRVTFCCGHNATVAPLLLNTASSLQRLGFRKAFRRSHWIKVDLATKKQNRKFHLKELRLKSLTRWP